MPQFNWYNHATRLLADELVALQSVLVIAPHQDDESLGCGGTIALLKQAGIPVHVVFVSDGSMSHPNSKLYDKAKLIALREAEAIAALNILGVSRTDITFLRLPDSQLPNAESIGFEDAVDLMYTVIDTVKPTAIFVPWQRDPHKDHRATWQITDAAINRTGIAARRLEYLIWLWERAATDDLPKPGEMKVWQVDITKTLSLKKQAIAAHESQVTSLIDDDPGGFTLSGEVLAHFDKPVEIFVERVKS